MSSKAAKGRGRRDSKDGGSGRLSDATPILKSVDAADGVQDDFVEVRRGNRALWAMRWGTLDDHERYSCPGWMET